MIATCIPDVAKYDLLAGGVHTAGKTFMCALFDSTADLGATNDIYTSVGETTGTGYVEGGNALTGFQIFDDTINGAYYIRFDTVEWTSASFNADGFVIYNADEGNKILVIIGFGQTWYDPGGSFILELGNPGVIVWYKG